MNKKVFKFLMAFMVVCLGLAAIGTLPARADDSAPPPDAPVEVVDTGNTDSNVQESEPVEVQTNEVATEEPAASSLIPEIEESAPQMLLAAPQTLASTALTGPSDQSVEDLTNLVDSNGNGLHGDVDCVATNCEKVNGSDLPDPDSNNETVIPFEVIDGDIIVIHAGGGNQEYPPIDLNSGEDCDMSPGGDAFCAYRNENGEVVIVSNPCAELVGKKNNCQPAPDLSYVLSVEGKEDAACPTGTHGTPPNCIPDDPEVCPVGTTGTPPNCVPVVIDPCEGLNGLFDLTCWFPNEEKDKSKPDTKACVQQEQILADNGKDIFWFDKTLGVQVNITSSLGGLNTHGSFNQTNPCLEMVFGHRENAGSAPNMWIYDGSFHQVFHDGKAVQGDGWDWNWQGNKIAFVSDGSILIITPDGKTLTDTNLSGVDPDWSPDGKDLAFSSLQSFMSMVETSSWTHVRDYIETPMIVPHIAPEQKFVCGNEYCLDLPNNIGNLKSVWGKYNDLAFDPSAASVLTVDADSIDIVDSSFTVPGTWFNPDWYSTQKAGFVPIK